MFGFIVKLCLMSGIVLAILNFTGAVQLPALSQLSEKGRQLSESEFFTENFDFVGERVGAPSSAQTYYKWRDRSGQWHYGAVPDEDGENIQVLIIEPSRPSTAESQSAGAHSDVADAVGQDPAASAADPSLSYDPSRIGKLIQDASSVQAILDRRKRLQDEQAGITRSRQDP